MQKTTHTTARSASGLKTVTLMALAMSTPLAFSGEVLNEAGAPEFATGSTGGWADWFSAVATASATYNSNITNDDSDEESDLIYIASLAMTLADPDAVANQWSLTYTPAYRIYQDNSDFNGVDQSFVANLTNALPKTTFDSSASYNKSSGTNRFTNGFVDSEIMAFSTRMTHALSGKTRLDAMYDYSQSQYGGSIPTVGSGTTLPDTINQTLKAAALYSLTGKINLGPYASYNWTNVDDGADHNAYEVGLATEYFATAKTSLQAFTGYEMRDFSGEGAGDRESASLSLAVNHQYSAKTSFDLELYRQSQASPSSSRDGYDATGLALSCDYQMSEKIGFYGSVAYELAEYYSTLNGEPSITPDADYYVFTLGSSYALADNLSLGGAVTYSENDSKQAPDSYENITATIHAAYSF